MSRFSPESLCVIYLTAGDSKTTRLILDMRETGIPRPRPLRVVHRHTRAPGEFVGLSLLALPGHVAPDDPKLDAFDQTPRSYAIIGEDHPGHVDYYQTEPRGDQPPRRLDPRDAEARINAGPGGTAEKTAHAEFLVTLYACGARSWQSWSAVTAGYFRAHGIRPVDHSIIEVGTNAPTPSHDV